MNDLSEILLDRKYIMTRFALRLAYKLSKFIVTASGFFF